MNTPEPADARPESARRRIARQQATTALRRRERIAAVASISLVLALFAGLVVAKAAISSTAAVSAVGATGAPVTASQATTASTVAAVTTLPASVYAAIGAGGVTDQSQPTSGDQPLTSGGKPDILYLGAEYCPYCAAERWPLVAALSRFGTFTGLGLTASSSTDVYPDTDTLTFLHAAYSSPYLAFTPVELADRDKATLQTPTANEQNLLDKYTNGGIPFIDLGGTAVLSSAAYSPQLLAGMDWNAIASALRQDPSGPVAQSVIGAANQITAHLCTLTGGKPGSVCQAPEIRALEGGTS